MASPMLRCTPTLVSRALFFLFFLTNLTLVFSRDAHSNLLSSRLDSSKRDESYEDTTPVAARHHRLQNLWDDLDEWAGVQGSWESLSKPSRQSLRLAPTPTSNARIDPLIITPTLVPLLGRRLDPRDLFTSNVCPISTVTTVFISIEGTSTVTVSTTVGPRSTGIPGDTGTSGDGGPPSGNRPDDNPTAGGGISDKEGLITGIVVVVGVLVAAFCALGAYCYRKRRRRAISHPKPTAVTSDTGELVRRMGTKGLQSLANPGDPPQRQRPGGWNPFYFFGRSSSTSPRHQRKESLDSNELQERKRSNESATVESRGRPSRTALDSRSKSRDTVGQDRLSSQTFPQIISSPVLSVKESFARPPSPRRTEASPSPRSSMNPDYVPLVSKRVSQANISPRTGLLPAPHETSRVSTASNLRYEAYPPRNSQAEVPTPTAWVGGYSLASTGNADPFLNPAVSPSDGQATISTGTHSRVNSRSGEGPSSPASSILTARLNAPPELGPGRRLTLFTDLRPATSDGASEILGTLGSAFEEHENEHDRDHHEHDHMESTEGGHGSMSSEGHAPPRRNFTALSDVEEVLTPVADERQSHMFPPIPAHYAANGAARPAVPPAAVTSPSQNSSGGSSSNYQLHNPFGDDAGVPSTWSRRKPDAHGRRTSEASEKPNSHSGSISVTGTSIVDVPTHLDTADWDSASIRRREEERLFFAGALRDSPTSQNSGKGQPRPRTTSQLSQPPN